MSLSCRTERTLLSYDEFTLVERTHHPGIRDLDIGELHAVRTQLRKLRDQEAGFVAHKGRVRRGKAELRGGSFPGTAERPKRRKQVFANAVKRLNGEVARIDRLAARARTADAAQRALALRRAKTTVHHPAGGDTPLHGLTRIENRRSRTKVHPGKIGRVSQATKQAQAIRDNRS